MDKRIAHLYHTTESPHHPLTGHSGPDKVPSGTVLRITSQKLFAGALELEITHQGAQYRLRQTALGKLILTK